MPDAVTTSTTPARPETAVTPAPTTTPRRGVTILLVDPDDDGRERVRRWLHEDGYRVVGLPRLDAAEATLADVTPEIVIIDAAALADGCPGRLAHAFPVVLVIPADYDTAGLAHLDVRIDACLIKPLRPIELLARVAAAVRARRRELAEMGLRELRGEQARMWTVLLDFSRAMGRALSLDEVIERLVLVAAQMTCSRRVSLMLPDDDRETLRIVK
ncbi:MAG: response regulator transcription factor, partial [Phycisphaerales bacterium]|nr:response regulator transcription factor [Phycisphaerales bacterium]